MLALPSSGAGGSRAGSQQQQQSLGEHSWEPAAAAAAAATEASYDGRNRKEGVHVGKSSISGQQLRWSLSWLGWKLFIRGCCFGLVARELAALVAAGSSTCNSSTSSRGYVAKGGGMLLRAACGNRWCWNGTSSVCTVLQRLYEIDHCTAFGLCCNC